MTAAHREEMIDSIEKELLALIEKRKNMDRKEKAQVKDISKKIKLGNRDYKRSKRHEKVQNILEEVKRKKIDGEHQNKKNFSSGNIKATRRGIANTFAKFYEDLYSNKER